MPSIWIRSVATLVKLLISILIFFQDYFLPPNRYIWRELTLVPQNVTKDESRLAVPGSSNLRWLCSLRRDTAVGIMPCALQSACILPWHIWLTNTVDDGCGSGSNDQQLYKLQPYWTTLSARSTGRKHITYIFLCCLIWWRDLPKVAIGNGPQITTALETMKKVFPIYSYPCLFPSSTLLFLLQFFRKSISSCVLLFFHLHNPSSPPPRYKHSYIYCC